MNTPFSLPTCLKKQGRVMEELNIDKNDPYSLLKLELKRVNELITENKELQKKYPKHKRGLKITLTTLEMMKKMLEEQIGENPELIK